jgi:AcrR family transcriptional regulator
MLDRLLDAAEASFDRHGVGNASMEDVAAIAGVSRGFVYKHLRNRDGLILAVLVRRARRFNDRAASYINAQPSLAQALVEGILLAVNLASRDPYFGLLVGAATTDPANRVAGASEAAAMLTDELWRPVLERGRERGELSPAVDLDDVVQWIMYLELILLASRSTFGIDEVAHERQLRTLFLPALLSPVAETAAPVEPGSRA